MLVPLFAGCIGGDDGETDRVVEPADPGYDAEELRVTGVATHELTIDSDGTELAAILYEPLTSDSIDGEDARWPLVVFVHPWGFPKETYQNAPLATDGAAGAPQDLLQQFAQAGLMSVAYDTRGWGESGGQSTVAGPAEMRDLRAVIDHVNASFSTNGRVGVTGASYGGGHAFLAWEQFDDVVTAVPHNGWVDLYEGVFPGNVPKLEWGAALYGTGTAGGGQAQGISPIVTDWLATGVTRQSAEDMDGVERQLDVRSVMPHGVAGTDKPLLLCGAITDTLFNQHHLAWQEAHGFTRSVYYQGGHNTLDADCWTKTKEWFQFFLAGIDTEVDTWPFLETVDVSGEGPSRAYSQPMAAEVRLDPLYLREGKLVEYEDPSRTFNVQQMLLANPFTEPSLIWETTGMPYQSTPEQLRQDPTGLFFESAPMEGTHTLLGAPRLTLELAEGTAAPFQVTATLYHQQDGNLRLLGRGATSPLAESDLNGNATVIDLPWIKADVHPGDALVLKVASSDPSIYAPLLANFDAEFTGASRLDVPFFAPPAMGG